ncbi:MAG TPA: alpha/beta hydrolase [Polyangiaceae bacterium]|nr:alpha/beta hydrolase [Polyangiaceae bacterium]
MTRTTHGHIDSLEAFDVGGTPQWVLLRGNPEKRRVLLVVQQGPGLPMIHEARFFERELRLESEAIVAYWDQRGTGKSFRADPASFGLDRLVGDVRALVDALCARLHVDQVDVLGLSIGGSLATLAAAENPARFGHLVVVGLDVDWDESERYAYAFACDEAERRGDRRAQSALRAIGAPPHGTSEKFLTRARWVAEYGGINRKRGFYGMLWDNVRRILSSPHYSLVERVQALLGIERTQRRVLASATHFDLRKQAPRVGVPVSFFQGRRDVGTNPHLVARYADAVDAPRGKSLVWFEESAHVPYYEEPARFREALVDALGWSS